MLRAERLPDVTLRLCEWSAADELDLDGVAARLDDGGRQRLATSAPADARRFLIGRALLTRTMAEEFGVAPELIRITATCATCGLAHGRPTVTIEGAPVRASISHTAGATAVAVSAQSPVGVDVERLMAPRFAGIEAVALSPDELRRWQLLPESDRLLALAGRWTMKEAVLKALGTGLTVDPATIELPRTIVSDRPTSLAGHRFLLSRPEAAPGLVLAVAQLLH